MAQLESFRQQFWPHVRPIIAELERAGDAERAAWLRRGAALLDPALAPPGRLHTPQVAQGESVIKYKSSPNVLKDTYDYSCY